MSEFDWCEMVLVDMAENTEFQNIEMLEDTKMELMTRMMLEEGVEEEEGRMDIQRVEQIVEHWERMTSSG
jgi:hypothetical protein